MFKAQLASAVVCLAGGYGPMLAGAQACSGDGLTAGRPGHVMVAGPRRWVSQRGPRASVRRQLTSGEGSGDSWCSSNGGYQLGAAFDGVYACGPATGTPDAFDTVGFQCVEMSARFLWAVYGDFVSNVPDGRALVSVASSALAIPVVQPAQGVVPAPGDVISMWGDGNAQPYGHTAVVTAVQVNSSGDGVITLMEENGLASGWDRITVSNWVETYGDANYGDGVYYYTHFQWLELSNQTPTPPPVPPSVTFAVHPLGVNTYGTSINDAGDVVGVLRPGSGSDTPFVYENARLTPLRVPGPAGSAANAVGINDSGTLAAWVRAAGQATAYTLPTQSSSRWHTLPRPAVYTKVERATGIDSFGDVSGWSHQSGSPGRSGVVWFHAHGSYQPEMLSPNPGYIHAVVAQADHWGDAAGSETTASGASVPVIWAPWGTGYRLPTLSGTHPDGAAAALAIKVSNGTRVLSVVGWSTDSTGLTQACSWKVTLTVHHITWSSPTVLATPTGFEAPRAVAVDSLGWVVGNASKNGTAGRAFLWRPKAPSADINTLLDPASGWVVLNVAGINNQGEILAQAYNRSDSPGTPAQAVVLVPTSLPVWHNGHRPNATKT